MALSGAELKILITAQDTASRQIKGVGGALRGLGSAAALPLKAIGGLTNALGKIGLAAFGIQALVGVVRSIGGVFMGPINAASNFSESLNKANVVFGKSIGVIDEFAKTSAQAFGQSQQQVYEMTATFGNLFVTMGLGGKAAANMSVDVVRLASDLASFNNVDTPEVLEAIRSGLIGETEPMRKFGVVISESAVAAQAASMGLGRLTKKGKESSRVFTEAEKVQARYALMMKQTTTAQGDFTRTSKGMANAQRIIDAQWKDIQVTLGNELLPVIAPIVSAFATGLPRALEKVMPLIKGVGEVLRGLIGAATSGDWSVLYAGLQNAFGTEMGIKISNVVEGIKNFITNIKDAITTGDWSKVTLAIQTAISDAWTGVKALAVNVWDKLTGATTTTDNQGIVTTTRVSIETMLKNAWAAVKVTGIDIWQKLFGQGNISTNTGGNMPDIGDMAVDGMSTDTRGLAQKLQQWLGAAIAGINWTTLWGSVKEAAGSAIATALTIATSVKDWLVTTWQGIPWADVWAGATTIGQGLLAGIMSIAGEVGTWLQTTWAGIDWQAVWKFATGIGQGIIDAAIDISGALSTWLGQQIGKVDPKIVYGQMPPPPTGAATGGADFGGFVKGILEGIGGLVMSVPAALNSVSETIRSGKLLDTAGSTIGWSIYEAIGSFFSAGTGGPTLGEVIGRSLEYVWDYVKGLVNVGTAIAEVAGSWILRLGNEIDVALTGKDGKQHLSEAMGIYFTIGPEAVTSGNVVGADYVRGVVGGIDASKESVKTAANDVGASMVTSTRGALQANSPSAAMYAVGWDAGAGLVNGLNAYRPNVSSAGWTTGRALSAGIQSGILAGESMVIKAAIRVAQAAARAAKAELGIASPSKVFAGIGQDVAGGMAQGMERGTRMLADASRQMATSTMGISGGAPAFSMGAALSSSSGGSAPLSAASTRPPISITITGNTFMGDDRSTAKRIAEILKPELDNLVRWR